MGDQVDDVDASSPATRLLDALGRGDLNSLLLEFRPTTIVRTEDRTWSVQGEEEVLYWLEEAFERFPGLVFDSHARHVGYGQVIEEARVRDIGPLHSDDAPATTAADDGAAPPDAPAQTAGALVRDRDFGRSEQRAAEHAGPADRAARRRLRARDHRQLPARPAAVRAGPARRPARQGRLGDPVGLRRARRLGVQDLPAGLQAPHRDRVRPGRPGPAGAHRRAGARGRAGAREPEPVADRRRPVAGPRRRTSPRTRTTSRAAARCSWSRS